MTMKHCLLQESGCSAEKSCQMMCFFNESKDDDNVEDADDPDDYGDAMMRMMMTTQR